MLLNLENKFMKFSIQLCAAKQNTREKEKYSIEPGKCSYILLC